VCRNNCHPSRQLQGTEMIHVKIAMRMQDGVTMCLKRRRERTTRTRLEPARRRKPISGRRKQKARSSPVVFVCRTKNNTLIPLLPLISTFNGKTEVIHFNSHNISVATNNTSLLTRAASSSRRARAGASTALCHNPALGTKY
jgi:hypothetical protein